MNIDTNGFELDDIAEDTTTGYTGRIVGMTQWLTGCARAILQMPIDPKSKDGKVPENVSADVVRLRLITAGPNHATTLTAAAAKGGPMPTPSRGR